MAGHIVRTFQGMGEADGIFRNQIFEIFVKIVSCGRIGILENDQTGAGMGDENCGGASLNAGLADNILYLAGNFDGSFAAGVDAEGFGNGFHGDCVAGLDR